VVEKVFRYVWSELMGDENETKDEGQVEGDEAIVHERVKVWLVEAIHVSRYVEFLCVAVNQLSSEINNKLCYLILHH
jgi:hypothetical protein